MAAAAKASAATEAGPAVQPSNGGAHVTVYLKHGPGLFLRVGKMIPMNEPSPMGMREIPGGVFRETGRVHVAGPLRPFSRGQRVPIVAGYAVTHGVPKEMWESWFEQNKSSDMVRNKIIFAHESESYGNGEANENRDRVTGMEPLRTDKDPRTAAVTRATSTMSGIEPFVRTEG